MLEKITNNSLQVLLSGYLGDGCFIKNKVNHYFKTNCIHLEYIDLKSNLLQESFKVTKETKINGGYKSNLIHSVSTNTTARLNYIATLDLKDALEMLTDLGLALWFYDDGSLHKKKYFYNLNTHSFTEEEHNTILIPYLESKLSIKVNLAYDRKKDGRVFCYCRINKLSGASKVSALLDKYIIDCYTYKRIPQC